MILSFRKFKQSHTAINITNFIEDELRELNILDKIVSITTDNEASVAAAGSQINDNISRMSCMCHNLNLVVKNGLKLWIKPVFVFIN